MKRHGLLKLRNAIDIQVYETELEIAELSKDAYTFNEFQLKNKVMCSLFSHKVDEKKACNIYRKRVYHKYLKLTTFRMMKKLFRFLREENKIIEEHQMKVVRRFRLIKLGQKVLKAMVVNAEDSKICREKDVYKNMIRGKVQDWLKEFHVDTREEAKSTQSTDEKDKIAPPKFKLRNEFDTSSFLKKEGYSAAQQLLNENFSCMSKDMFDERFEMTKDELFSNPETTINNTSMLIAKQFDTYQNMQGKGVNETISNQTLNTLDFDNQMNKLLD